MFPIRDNVPSRRIPVMTVLLITANVAAFLYTLGLSPRGQQTLANLFGVVPERFSDWARDGGAPLDPFRFLPLVTSLFLHGGWKHLLGNMWFLWIFGDNVEDVLGHFRYLVFYLAAGMVAALAQVAAAPHTSVPTLGASGAIAGVLGAYFVLYPRARVLTLIPLFFIPWFVEVPAILFLGLWFVLQVLSGVAEVGTRTLHGGVAWWAHAAGFGAGIVLLAFLRPSVRRAPVW